MAIRQQADARDELAGAFADLTPLHRGVHSELFYGYEQVTGRWVAIKLLAVDGVTKRAREAFERESAVLAAIGKHPNIVSLYRSFELSDGRPALVLELCRGSLSDRLVDGPIPPAEAVSMAIKLAGALETAHRGSVLHRDVRPANILVTEFGEPALVDFGLAHLRSSVPAPAELFDFPSTHVAPELMLGREASPPTDVYGLASSLYEMLTGQAPLAAYSGESPAASILRILRDPVRPVVGGDIPLELSDLLMWCLNKEPGERPPTAYWLAEELGRIEAHNGWLHTRVLVREPGQIELGQQRQPRHQIELDSDAPPDVPAPAPPAGPATVAPATSAPVTAQPEPGGEAGPAVAEAAAPPAPPRWAPPTRSFRSAPSSRGRGGRYPRLVLRAPLLAVLGRFSAVAVPLWVAAVIVLVEVWGSWWAVAATGAIGVALTFTLARFVRPSLTVEPCHLRHRDGLARVLIPWPAVVELRAQYRPSRGPGAPHAVVVAVGVDQDMPLPATLRPAWRMHDLIARIESMRPNPAESGQDR